MELFKDFDTIDLSLLIAKLNPYGFSTDSLKESRFFICISLTSLAIAEVFFPRNLVVELKTSSDKKYYLVNYEMSAPHQIMNM